MPVGALNTKQTFPHNRTLVPAPNAPASAFCYPNFKAMLDATQAPVPNYDMASYSRPNCAELEASPVSLLTGLVPSVTLVALISWGRCCLSHAETTRRGPSGAVLAHLAELRLEPREIRRLGCLSGWGRVASPRCAHPSGRRPTYRQTGPGGNSKAGSDQARMRCMAHFESKV